MPEDKIARIVWLFTIWVFCIVVAGGCRVDALLCICCLFAVYARERYIYIDSIYIIECMYKRCTIYLSSCLAHRVTNVACRAWPC